MEASPFLVDGNNPYFLSGTTPLNEKIYGFSTDLGDVDRYYLDARPGEAYLISVSGVGADIFDPKLIIRNRAGEVVSSSSGAWGSYDPVISFQPELGGGYTIDVVNEDDISGSFPFVFSIQEASYTNPYSRPHQALQDPITGLQDLETKASFDSAIGDSVLTKKELENLLYSAGDGGEVSAQEFNDLRVISWHLSSYLAPDTATYYKQIFDNVVLGSDANAHYTGGDVQSQALGDLQVGSSSEHLDKLIGKWFLGSDLPNPLLPGDAAAGQKDVIGVYASANGPLFSGPIEFSDINQGYLGDCWLLAATASVASHEPDAIRNLFIDNGDGTYGVRFQALSKEWESKSTSTHWITVNRQLLVNPYDPNTLLGVGSTLAKSLTDEIWPGLLEKAAAQASELKIFQPVRGELKNNNAYYSLDGGHGEGLLMLQPSYLVTGTPDAYEFYYGNTSYLNSSTSWESFLSSYESAIDDGNGPAVIGSFVFTTPSLDSREEYSDVDLGLVKGHAFALLDAKDSDADLTIYNPWGPSQETEFGPSISPFTASKADYINKFATNSANLVNLFSYSVT